MPVVFGPTLRRIAGTEPEADADDRARTVRPGRLLRRAVTERRAALGALLAAAGGWLAARRLRGERTPPIEPPFAR
jgi:hypothetical protein